MTSSCEEESEGLIMIYVNINGKNSLVPPEQEAKIMKIIDKKNIDNHQELCLELRVARFVPCFSVSSYLLKKTVLEFNKSNTIFARFGGEFHCHNCFLLIDDGNYKIRCPNCYVNKMKNVKKPAIVANNLIWQAI